MPKKEILKDSVDEAVETLVLYLEDTSIGAHKSIYFDGWDGLAASAVLRAIAENPGESLRKKFDKIIHVDCSRWKSRRQLQRAIADKLKLPRHVMDLFDRHDEEDDFSGVEESSRAEIADIRREIYRTFMDSTCLLILNNGSDYTVDISSLGFPLNDWYNLRDNRLLWTFRGRLRLNPKIADNVDSSHLFLYTSMVFYLISASKVLLAREAKEITQYSGELRLDGTKAAECCSYLFYLNRRGGNEMDYNWATHAYNYWVCDGIITVQEEEEEEGGRLQEDQAWEVAAALHHEIRLEDYTSNSVPDFGHELFRPPNRWVLVTEKSNMEYQATLDTTSMFVARQSVELLPDDMFHQANKLRVLRLCYCAFNFSSPPFHCCHNLRFLGLDKCQDHRAQEAGEDKTNISPALEIFQRLWVLDICYTDWELDFPTESTKEQEMVMNIREVHINKGRIWRSNFGLWRLKKLQKLRVIEPTHPWGNIGEMDILDLLKLKILDLSRNTTIQVLPSLSGASSLKTLILDGCVVLERVGPQGLPSSLESFSFDSRQGDETKISSISLAGCSSLVSFTLRGPLPELKNLDLSGTIIKMLDLRDVHSSSIGQILLLGCDKLRTILWPEEGLPNLRVLRIDSLVCHVETEHQQAHATVMELRFVQSLVLRSNGEFCWNCDKTHINICIPSTPKDTTPKKETIGCYSTQKVVGSPLHMPIITIAQPVCYKDVNLDTVPAIYFDTSTAPLHEPLDIHVEIGEGISYANLVSEQALRAVEFMMDEAESLHVHDNFSITNVYLKHKMDSEVGLLPRLKWCCIERCHKLNTVFSTDYFSSCFETLEAFSASDLMMASCIWSRGRTTTDIDDSSFANLRSIHLHYCPRLRFVLPLSWYTPYSHLPSLETIRIVCCGELRQIFPVEPVALSRGPRGVMELPKLKHIHLHDVPKLQQICDSRMVAPKLETIRVRGCWGLKRIMTIGGGRRQDNRRPIMDCEKDWWDKLEWDDNHSASLFEPRHSMYYKKKLPRGSLLR